MCELSPWPLRYDLDHDLGSRSCHTLGLRSTTPWNIIQTQLSSKKLRPGPWFQLCVHCDLVLGEMIYDPGSRLWHILELRSTIVWNIIQIQLSSKKLRPGQGFLLYVHFDLGSRSWHILGLWTTIVWNIIHICKRVKKLCPGQGWWTDRRTDRHGDSYILLKLGFFFFLGGGVYKIRQ